MESCLHVFQNKTITTEVDEPKMNDEMLNAYRAAQRIVERELSDDDRRLLADMNDSDVIVVEGTYDRVQDVLKLANLQHRVIPPAAMGTLHLQSHQLLIVNCPGQVGRAGITAIRDFVERGGSLITTDWALKYVLEPAFPGLVAYNEHPTADDVVRIEIASRHPFLSGVFQAGADPLWWLEGSSYPIRVLDPERVRVLLKSNELAAMYGESPVAVAFEFGAGDVLHMISHYYLQRTELRTDRHKSNWSAYAAEVGASDILAEATPEFSELTAGQVESAHKSLRFITNAVTAKRRRERR
jgi:hypothetical protein